MTVLFIRDGDWQEASCFSQRLLEAGTLVEDLLGDTDKAWK